NDELWARCSLYRLLLSGPGDDAEGIDARAEVAAPTGQVGGITPAAWKGLDAEELRSEQIAGRTQATQALRVAGGGGAAGNWMGGMGGALAPTEELLAQVDALPPATADPH